MVYFLGIIFCLLSSDLSTPYLKPPEKSSASSELPTPVTAQDWYERSLEEIRQGKRAEAKKSLQQALLLQPNLLDAQIQLGFIELWQAEYEQSYRSFSAVLKQDPCNQAALEGYRELGFIWSQVESKQQNAVQIYTALDTCYPNDPDTLFYLGRALGRTKNWDLAEIKLRECLELAPNYGDAEVQLAYVYLWQERYAEAEELFLKHLGNSDAKMGLALATKRQGKTEDAKKHLDDLLIANPKHRQARREKGRMLSEERDYSGAEAEFSWIDDDDPNDSNYWAELFDIKSHTRYAFLMDGFYTYAKENDPSLGVPVVKDYYFLNTLHLLVPVNNQWRLDLKEMFYHQRENDIYRPFGVNYSMYLSGGQVTSSYFFAKNWRWDLSARGFRAWGAQDVSYPFQHTSRFEPGTGLIYNSERQLFSIDAHIESFVIKNFSQNNSSLLRTDYLTGGYIYRLDTQLKPEVEAWISHVFIHDNLHNWENTETAVARCGLPFVADYITAIYRFEHGHFDELSQNYYSFKQQLRNVLGTRLRVPFGKSVSWDTYYYHRWQTSYNLFQPIGDSVFVAAKQYLTANWVTSSITARYRDRIRLVLEGHYFHDTLPYRDWNVNGSFLWQF